MMEKEILLAGFRKEIGEPDASGIYGDTGISERTLDAYMDQLLSDVIKSDEEVNEAFFKSHCKFLRSVGGQIRHENAEFAKAHAASMNQGGAGGEDLSRIRQSIEQLRKDNEELKERLSQQDSRRTQEELRRSVVEGMKSKGATDEYVLKSTLKGVVFDSERTVEQMVECYLAEYDKEFAEARGKGAAPRTSLQQQQNQRSEFLRKLKEKHQKEGRLPASETKS